MKSATALRLLSACLLAGVAGCTPSLNWRDVQLGKLTTLLPCKPDTGMRDVVLGGQAWRMDMAGCEADGALFAISRVQAATAAQAAGLLAALRQASLAQVGAKTESPTGAGAPAPDAMELQVDGLRANGSALQVHFKWMVQGAEVYQIAAYADHLAAEQTEPLLREARIR